VKGVRVSDYNGRSLSTGNSSHVEVRPDIPAAHALQAWHDQGKGKSLVVQQLSKRGALGALPFLDCGQIATGGLGGQNDGGKGDFFSLVACINVLQFNGERPPWYLACPSAECNKKVTEAGAGGQWHCDKCNKTYPTCEPRYIFSCCVADGQGSQWLSCFDEAGAAILGGRTAADYRQLYEAGDVAALESAFRQANFQEHTFKVKAKMERVQDQDRLRCTVLAVSPVDQVAQIKRNLDLIRAYV